MIRIPASLSEIDRDWIAACLGSESQALTGITLQPMGEGVGMMSAMARIVLDWRDPNKKPKSLVVKLAAENETNRSVATQFNLYAKEVRYYQELADRTRASNPIIYAADIDANHCFYLVMEDVSDYVMGDQVAGATLNETMTCVTELARLHGAFWNNIEDVGWLPHMSGSDNARNMALGAETGWTQLVDYFGEFVPASMVNAKDRYLSQISSLQVRLDQAPITLIHGDFRMDNMLFGCKPEHRPLVVVDYQGPLKGKGIHDLAYLLSHSVQVEVRRAHEQEILRHYVQILEDEGVSDYDFDTAWADYRLGVLYCWTVAVVIAGTMDPANDRGYAWMSKMVERNGIAIDDLNCLDLLD